MLRPGRDRVYAYQEIPFSPGEGWVGVEVTTRTRPSSLPHPLHCPWIVSPVELQLICKRPGEPIQIREQRRLRDIHSIQLTHTLLSNFVCGQDELDQCLFGIR